MEPGAWKDFSPPPHHSYLHLPKFEGRENETAENRGNINLKLVFQPDMNLHNLTLPIPGAWGYPQDAPAHLIAGKSLWSEHKQTKKTLLLHLLLWFSRVHPSPRLTLVTILPHKRPPWSCRQSRCATCLVRSLKSWISSFLILQNII